MTDALRALEAKNRLREVAKHSFFAGYSGRTNQRANASTPLVDRIVPKIAFGAPGDCWLWQGCIRVSKGDRRPIIRIGGEDHRAYRVLYEMAYGTIPPGMMICHRRFCNNSICVNPEHLYAGTSLSNSDDAIATKRKARGSRIGAAKLSEGAVGLIKRLLVGGIEGNVIARQFGVDETTISQIKKGKTWKHV